MQHTNGMAPENCTAALDILQRIVAWAGDIERWAGEFEHLGLEHPWLGEHYLTNYIAVIAENAHDLYGDARATATSMGLGYIPPPEASGAPPAPISLGGPGATS